MNLKKRQSMILGIIVAFVMISVGLFAGCTSNNTNPSDNTPIISDNNLAVIKSAYNEYDMLRQNTSAKNARQQLIQKINTEYEGVENAHLGIDNYTIFIEYSDGGCSFVDTYESNESNNLTSEVGFMASGGGISNNDYNSQNTLRFDDVCTRPVETGYTSGVGGTFESTHQLLFDVTQEKVTPSKKKVLILCPCYWQFSKQPWVDAIALFKGYGWIDEDIVIKVVELKSKVGLNGGAILPEDYFNLDDYGIILFSGHGGIDKNYNEDNLYLQFCYISSKTIKENSALKEELKELYYEKKLLFGLGMDGYDGTTEVSWEETYIRADLLRENMDTTLPGSYVYLATCFGGYFDNIFRDKGAKIFLGYNRGVRGDIADENMLNMVKLLLEKNYCVHAAFLDNTVIKNSIFEEKEVQLNIYPDPFYDSISNNFYFPTWFDKITVTDIPEEADSIDVTMISETGISMKSKSYPVSSSTFTVTDFNDFVFPATVTRTIRVNALDASKEVLADGQSNFTLSAGANLKQINLTEKKGTEESKYVEYNSYGTNVTINFTVSSNKWETGKEVTATAICTSSGYTKSVTGFNFFFHNCNVTIVAYNPPFRINSSTGKIYGGIKNGTLAEIRWWSDSYSGIESFGTPATFTIRFRLNSRHAGYVSSIQASYLGHEESEMPSIVFR